MSKKGKKRLIWAVLLAAILPALAYLLSQGKYWTLCDKYRENAAAFHSSTTQLETLLGEVGKGEAWHHRTDPYIEVRLSGSQITSLTLGREERGPEGFPQLTETVAPLGKAGVYKIQVYDFPDGGKDRLEVWYHARAGSLIYAASGELTYSHDPSNWDWGGYRFYQKRLNKNWFIMVSRYDKDSPYWRM